MSDALETGVGDRLFGGSVIVRAGWIPEPIRTAPQPACASCGCVHRFYVYEPGSGIGTIFDDVCTCGCLASASAYDGTIRASRAAIDAFGEFTRATTGGTYHYDDDKCAHGLSAASCRSHVGSHTGGVRGLDEGGDLRGGWLDRFLWPCLSRLFGNQRSELVRQRWRL